MPYEESFDNAVILRIGSLDIRYYLREPSPDHWNAIGVIERHDLADGRDQIAGYKMIVGVGASEDEAIGDLIARVLVGQSGGPMLPPATTSRRLYRV
ncbi:MAG: hypothetical protein EA415_08560 [Sphaerobacteraceae bacterium]|nr:MAG: hypothetical protein EA415_08560 [Sphaerobacteraceae bacterium]